jgi:hypothetical protein
MTARGLFISEAIVGNIYVAERSCKGRGELLWSMIPAALNLADVRIEASMFPQRVRRQAYRYS